MKLTNNLVISFILGLILINNIIAAETLLQKTEDLQEVKCENPCQGKYLYRNNIYK